MISVALIVASLAMPVSANDAGACYVIADPDYRAFCLAEVHRDPGRCYVINRPDLRARCLAEVRK